MNDDEHLGLIELAVRERPDGVTIIAGVGSNDTRHAVELTSARCELGADALLSVNPYYNRPSRRGILAPLTRRSRPRPIVPIVLYNIPQRTGTDMPNDLLARARPARAHRWPSSRATPRTSPRSTGCSIYAGNDDMFARRPRPRRARRDPRRQPHLRPADAPDGRRAREPRRRSTRRSRTSTGPVLDRSPGLLAEGGARAARTPRRRPAPADVELDDAEREAVRAMLERHGLLGHVTA